MLSMLEGELPRTRGPNPLFWTHTLAHLSLTPNHLQLTLSPHPFPAPRIPLSYLLPPFLPSTALRLLLQRQTRHIARSVALLPRQASLFSPAKPSFSLSLRPPSPTVLRVQFCITIRRALRKLPRNFSLPRARPPLSTSCAGQLGAGSINSLSLFARASRANATHWACFSNLALVRH